MFKSRKKKQQQKAEEAAKAQQQSAAAKTETESTTTKYNLLDDIHLANDFRSSIILPQLNKDLDPLKLSRQQQHLAQLRDIPESPTTMSPPLSPPPPHTDKDGSKQYQDLAAWKKIRSQNRYSNGLFGGKQRGRPKPNQIKRFRENEQGDLQEMDEDEDNKYDEQDHDEVEKMDLLKEDTTPTEEKKILTLTPLPARSIIQQVQSNISENEDEDDEELDEEDEDHFLQEEYEPGSDTEENFFFQDFSADSNKKPTTNKKASRNTGRRRRSTKVMSKFDLSSFAQDLHDHRLSVIQPRESRIIMTEDDELELEKLLERQRARMSMMTMMTTDSTDSLVPPLPPPPMPSLDLIKPHQQKQQQQNKVLMTSPSPSKEAVMTEQQVPPMMNSDHGSTSTTNSISSNYSADEFSTLKIKTLVTTEKDTTVVPQQEMSVVPEFTNTAPPPVPVPTAVVTPSPTQTTTAVKPLASLSTSSTTSSSSPKIDQLKRSVSTTSIKSNNTTASMVRKRSNLTPIKDVEVRQNARKSLSMDNIHIKLDENEPSVTSAALDWINEGANFNSKISDPTSFVYKQQNHHHITTTTPIPQQTKSRSLFGSLRQVSRSKTHHSSNTSGSGIKGLVRNFSSSHKSSMDRTNVADSGMSRAAMAVIQHNVAKNEQRKAAPVIPQGNKAAETESREQQQQQQQQRRSTRTKSDSNNGGRLIAHLLARASSHTRKHNATKIVNMEKEDTAKKQQRAQVVRKTIIYVQPDSLHDLLKNGGDDSSIKMPPLPSATLPQASRPKINTRNTMASDGSLSPDDETIRSREYVTATKVVRQTSVRKRVETSSESNTSSPLSVTTTESLSRQGSKKRWQLKSVDENELLQQDSKHTSSSSSHSSNSNNEYLEGVELREMSDGSVVWGIVKKQGNRKSFFAPNHRNEYEHVEDEEEEPPVPSRSHKHNSSQSSPLATAAATPPPIPKRSPRRQVPAIATETKPTTDIYYSKQMTLPNLLKMMQDQHPGDDDFEEDDFYKEEDEDYLHERVMSSVDDQLDEMMRMLQQQQQQR